MKKTLKGIVMMIIIAMVISISNISSAFSFKANLVSKDKLIAGKEVKVTLSLSSINMDDGIYSIQIGKITVGNAFEGISQSSFSSNKCMVTYANGGLVLMSSTPIKSSEEVVTLTLKVKKGTNAKSDTVKFENIVASSGSNTGDISAGTKTIKIEAKKTNSGNDDTDKNSGNKDNSDTGSKKDNTSEKNEYTQEILPKRLPQTGEGKNFLIMLLMIGAIVISAICYIRYKLIKPKKV